MKPDWKDAPEWANYLAQDYNGSWYWFELQPSLSRFTWTDTKGGAINVAYIKEWKDSLEQRP